MQRGAMSSMKIEIDSQSHDHVTRKVFSFPNLLFTLVNSGIAAVFLFIATWILAQFRIEVLAGQPYEWPLGIKIISIIYVVISVLLLASQVLVLLGKRAAGRVLVGCLAFFFAAYAIEVLMAVNEYGLRHGIVNKLILAIIFLAWVISNYFFWLKKKAVVRSDEGTEETMGS
jgi:hypothetical protein